MSIKAMKQVPNADKIVYVEWFDCVTRAGWVYADDMKDWGVNHTIQTIGFLAYENEHTVTIAQSVDLTENPAGCNWLAIPKSLIKRKITL